jgi:hypothetical protein
MLTSDFLVGRSIWFVFELLVLAVTLFLLFRCLGSGPPWAAGLTGIIVLSPMTQFDLRCGNFQMVVLSLVVLAFLAFARGHRLAGAFALAFAILSKLFPALLVVYLVARGRWRDAAWTIAAAAVLILASVLAFGVGPHIKYVESELPALLSGSVYRAVLEMPGAIATNMSVPGLFRKVALIGLPPISDAAIRAIGGLWATLVLAGTVLIARRTERTHRGEMRAVVALFTLASLANALSPFYVSSGMLLCIAFGALDADTLSWQRGLLLAGVWILFALPVWRFPSMPLVLLFWTLAQLAGIAVCVWSLRRGIRSLLDSVHGYPPPSRA